MTSASGMRTNAATTLRIMDVPASHRFAAAAQITRRGSGARRSAAAVQALAHFLAGFEERHAFLVDRYARAGARIAAFARRPILHREGAEAAQLHPVAARQGGGDLVEDGVDDVFDVPLIKVRILRRNPLNELGFDHRDRHWPGRALNNWF